MPRKPTGNAFESRGRWYARVTLPNGERRAFSLPTCADEATANERAALLAELSAQFRASRHVPPDAAKGILERAAQRDGRALEAVRQTAATLCKGEAAAIKNEPAALTFKDIAQRWTSGELHQLYPDHVRKKTSASDDVGRLEKHVYPIVGDVPITAVSLDHAELVMRSLPEGRAPATRRHVAQLLHRVLALAVFPLRLITANPLPKGFLPKLGPGKAKGWLYPDKDEQLCSTPAVPLCWRVFYGFLNREGPRSSEAKALTWRDIDLDRGALTLDENKTDDPRAWALSPGCVAALCAWRKLREAETPLTDDDLIFINEAGAPLEDEDGTHFAERFRRHLQSAGITRPVLFERTATRQPVRLHDSRATFITIALANGRSEAWVQDRTGHKSSLMINLYRRAARTAAELGLGDLRPLNEAVPELAAPADPPREPTGGKGGGKGGKLDPAPITPAPTEPNSSIISPGSPARTRTGKPSRAKDFKSPASTIPPQGQVSDFIPFLAAARPLPLHCLLFRLLFRPSGVGCPTFVPGVVSPVDPPWGNFPVSSGIASARECRSPRPSSATERAARLWRLIRARSIPDKTSGGRPQLQFAGK